jgi:hypothetical protein
MPNLDGLQRTRLIREMGVNCNSPGHAAEPVEVPGSKDISNERGQRLVCIELLKGIIQNEYIEYICSREYRMSIRQYVVF